MNLDRLRRVPIHFPIHFPPLMYRCLECKGFVWVWVEDQMRAHQQSCSPQRGWMG